LTFYRKEKDYGNRREKRTDYSVVERNDESHAVRNRVQSKEEARWHQGHHRGDSRGDEWDDEKVKKKNDQ
jgi:hypothetical protein